MDLVSHCNNIRNRVLKLSYHAKSAHAGSALSCVEIIGSVMWLKYKQKKPISKFVLSKGHAAMALYSTAAEFGLIDESILNNYLSNNSAFWGHPSVSEKFEFIHWSTGSLGHGLPACVGFAYAEKNFKEAEPPGLVIAIVSDGELNEGTNWEAIQFAAHHKLNNLIVIVDDNKFQSFGKCDEVINLSPLDTKFLAFNCNAINIDGHSVQAITNQLVSASHSNKPTILIANTIKGKGVSSIENTLESHYKPITEEQLAGFQNAK